MFSKRILTVLVLCTTLISGTVVYATVNNITASKATTNSAPIKITTEKSSKGVTVNKKEFVDEAAINKNAKFQVKKPKVPIKGLVEQPSRLESSTFTKENTPSKTIDIVQSTYKDSSDPKRYIHVIQTEDTGKPSILTNLDNIKLNNNIDAWLTPTNAPIMQLMFWTDGKYYNVSGSKVTKDDLIKTANSLIQPS